MNNTDATIEKLNCMAEKTDNIFKKKEFIRLADCVIKSALKCEMEQTVLKGI